MKRITLKSRTMCLHLHGTKDFLVKSLKERQYKANAVDLALIDEALGSLD